MNTKWGLKCAKLGLGLSLAILIINTDFTGRGGVDSMWVIPCQLSDFFGLGLGFAPKLS